jgi:hypothetical protein
LPPTRPISGGSTAPSSRRPRRRAWRRRLDRDGLLRVSGTREARHAERLQYGRFLALSRRRAHLRWLKNIWTFEGWTDYMISKIKRHHGIAIVLSPRERRFPLLAAIRYYLRFRREKRLH